MCPFTEFHALLKMTPKQLIAMTGGGKKKRIFSHGSIGGMRTDTPEFYASVLRNMGADRESKLARAWRRIKELGYADS